MATEVSAQRSEETGLSRDALLAAYRTVYASRRIDDKEIQLKRQNRIFFQISGAGHEAFQVALAAHLRPGVDWVFPYYRDRALCLALGMTPKDMLLDAVGAAEGPSSSGRQMPSHWGSRKLNVFTTSSPTGSECLPGVGAAEAGRYLSQVRIEDAVSRFHADEVTVVTIGDGATSEGEFWEAIGYAVLKRLPVVFVVEDNGYAISVPVEANTPGGSISNLVRSYPGLFVAEVDGCDYAASWDAFRYAIAYCRERKGPSFVHGHVIRPYSHSLSDDDRLYRPESERQHDLERDPVTRMARELVEKGLATDQEIQALKDEVDAEIDRAAREALESPQPDPADVARNVYPPDVDPTSAAFDTEDAPASSGQPTTMVDLVNSTLKDEMGRDPRVVSWGEDVADATREGVLSECKGKGGVFKVTSGLQKAYGAERCFNSPLAEAGIVGRAIGWAARGLKPVVEIQFFDYIWPAMQQLLDELATVRWRSGGAFSSPVVVRVAIGGYLTGGGPYHSQSGEVTFTHIPGLRVAMPSTAVDAAGLLRTAIRCDDPVLFLEHKHLYRQTHNKGAYPGRDFMIPFGKAKVVREGTDITVVTYGATVQRAFAAANQLAETGLSVELIDLRTLSPWDQDTVYESVKKTNRVVVLYEDSISWGYGAEIAARIADDCFAWLDAPVKRLASTDTFVGYAPRLEDSILPQVDDVKRACEELVRF